MNIKRTLLYRSPQHGVCAQQYQRPLGAGRRVETRCIEASDDYTEQHQQRFSDDGGLTWSAWQTVVSEWPTQGDCTKQEILLALAHHASSGRTVDFSLQRITIGDPRRAMQRWWQGVMCYFDHTCYRTSPDDGRTWDSWRPLLFEEGPQFDPNDWGNGLYLSRNQLAGGYDAITTRDGSLVYACTATIPYVNGPDELRIPDWGKPGKVDAIVCFRGRWNASRQDFDFTASRPFWLPRRVSSRGLLEPTIAELSDGRLLLVMRGSNAATGPPFVPGRAWSATSSDGGATWGDVADLRYDTGESFYSPSSMSRLFRSRANGKLYWFGNITPDPPQGNGPRTPLVVGEIEEDGVSLKKSSVVILDQLDPRADSAALQLSNFTLLEEPDRGIINMDLSRLGQYGVGQDALTADAYRYAIHLD